MKMAILSNDTVHTVHTALERKRGRDIIKQFPRTALCSSDVYTGAIANTQDDDRRGNALPR